MSASKDSPKYFTITLCKWLAWLCLISSIYLCFHEADYVTASGVIFYLISGLFGFVLLNSVVIHLELMSYLCDKHQALGKKSSNHTMEAKDKKPAVENEPLLLKFCNLMLGKQG